MFKCSHTRSFKMSDVTANQLSYPKYSPEELWFEEPAEAACATPPSSEPGKTKLEFPRIDSRILRKKALDDHRQKRWLERRGLPIEQRYKLYDEDERKLSHQVSTRDGKGMVEDMKVDDEELRLVFDAFQETVLDPIIENIGTLRVLIFRGGQLDMDDLYRLLDVLRRYGAFYFEKIEFDGCFKGGRCLMFILSLFETRFKIESLVIKNCDVSSHNALEIICAHAASASVQHLDLDILPRGKRKNNPRRDSQLEMLGLVNECKKYGFTPPTRWDITRFTDGREVSKKPTKAQSKWYIRDPLLAPCLSINEAQRELTIVKAVEKIRASC